MEADSVDVKVTDKLEPRQQRVYDWRLEQFTSLGFYDQIAEALAGSTADLDTARRLHKAGCSLANILRILM